MKELFREMLQEVLKQEMTDAIGVQKGESPLIREGADWRLYE